MLFPSKLKSILVQSSGVNFVKFWPLITISYLPVSGISPNSSKRFFVKARWAFLAKIQTLSSHGSCSIIVEKFSLFSVLHGDYEAENLKNYGKNIDVSLMPKLV